MSYVYSDCPYCDGEVEIDYEGNEDGEDFEVRCDNCGKEFICNVEFEAQANCSKKLNEVEG